MNITILNYLTLIIHRRGELYINGIISFAYLLEHSFMEEERKDLHGMAFVFIFWLATG